MRRFAPIGDRNQLESLVAFTPERLTDFTGIRTPFRAYQLL